MPLIAPEEQERVGKNYAARIAGSVADNVYETKLMHKNGAIVDVEVSSGLISYGSKPAVLVIVRDISDRKKEAEKIANLEKAKSDFVSIAAHQLRTPIGAIKNALGEVLEGDLNITPDQKEFLDIVKDGSQQMDELVEFLLKISRAEAGTVKFALSPISLSDLTDDVLKEFSGVAEKKNINFTVVKDPDPLPYVFMDKNAVMQVISNLVSNAINYSPNKSNISLLIKQIDDVIEYSVKDSGIGIAEKDRPKIFQHFYRTDAAKETVATGTGLGLALVKSLVEAWGGKVWFDSIERQGTTFHITIPIVGKKEAQGGIL